MESRIARALRREQFARYAAMTPAQRVALAMRLGEEALASYMMLHGVDRSTALTRIKAAHRAGRRRSACAEPDADR